jgi:hypothetical protein
MFQHFDAALPNDLIMFKQVVNNTYINVYDTKRIHDHNKFAAIFNENLGLSELYSSIKEKENDIFSTPSITDVTLQNSQFHNAAFDSYATGYIFLKLK